MLRIPVYLLFGILFIPGINVHATSVEQRSLPQLLAETDHVLAGHVIKVDMLDSDGEPVSDNDATTGPGQDNTIRLHIKVNEVITTTAKSTPDIIILELWNAWHYTLGQIKSSANDEKAIYLLKDSNYQIVYPGYFRRGLDEKSRIIDIINQKTLTK